ncbi:KdsC family phosphatase [Parvibium lacunae]|uniref:3-deoxy-D-manno-octulosonate 8-phosphate phosphatase KdsC n=1 Tax=Parvibium lacunae TaxID=1888893 RepID=A0A368KZV1_9BURK|nr:phenylphosphate carboxylase subunit delta [Parvibium lacunae]RCS56827.1 phenylphosphate carboxylase subunit delta [Parvibium lacunae]
MTDFLIGSTLVADAVSRAANVQVMIFDVDGVLTDGRLYYGPDGEMLKAFHTLDGHGLKLLQQAGIRTAIITGRRSPMVAQRAQELGLTWVQQGIHDKAAAFSQLQQDLGVGPAVCGYMGDDVVDLPVMTRAIFAAGVPSTPAVMQPYLHWQSQAPAGAGAVREACDFILQAQGKLAGLVASYVA